jgi:predicted negative regulator of RcsB-dependent stress response
MDESEQLETLKRWWERYGTYLVVGIVVGLGGFFGWQGYQDYTQRQAERAAMLYDEYLELRHTAVDEPQDEPPAALTAALEEIDAGFRGTSYHTFTLFYRARDAALARDFERAAEILREAADSARHARLRDIARIRLARVEHELGQSEQALDTLRAVSGSGFRALVAEIKGDILLSKNDRQGARTAYEQALSLSQPDAARGLLEMKLADLATES